MQGREDRRKEGLMNEGILEERGEEECKGGRKQKVNERKQKGREE